MIINVIKIFWMIKSTKKKYQSRNHVEKTKARPRRAASPIFLYPVAIILAWPF